MHALRGPHELPCMAMRQDRWPGNMVQQDPLACCGLATAIRGLRGRLGGVCVYQVCLTGIEPASFTKIRAAPASPSKPGKERIAQSPQLLQDLLADTQLVLKSPSPITDPNRLSGLSTFTAVSSHSYLSELQPASPSHSE